MRQVFVRLLGTVALALGGHSGHAALHDRCNGMVYDDVLNITWLQDANYAQTSGFDADGRITWEEGVTWAANLVYGGYDDWRLASISVSAGLPTGVEPIVPTCSDSELVCRNNEIGYMFYFNLGGISGQDKSGDQTSLSGVQLRRIQKSYWTGTEFRFKNDIERDPTGVATRSWSFNFSNGVRSPTEKYFRHAVWAVRAGDVSNACVNPQITAASATPSTLLDTQTSQLAVTAVDPQPGPLALSYLWTVVSGGGTLSNATSANALYTPPNVSGPQTVVLRVAVSDGEATVTRELTLQVTDASSPPPPNAVPVISAASATPSTIWEGQQSQLTVTASDSDGPQSLSYAWEIVSGGGTLSNAAIANPVYTAPADVVGTQTVTLRVTVSDGAGSATRDVSVTVQDTTPPPPGTQILSQDFSVNSFAGWSFVDEGTISAPSKWRIVSGELVQQSNIRDAGTANDVPKLGTYLLYEDGLGWTDYKARFRLRSTDDDGLGLMFRFIDNDNWYRFSWDAQLKQRRLVKKAGGVYTLLAADSVPYVLGQNYQVEVVAQGSQLEVWVDGARIFQVTDASLPRGSVAFYTWQNNGAFFDNLVIEDLSGGSFNALPKITALSATPATILDTQTSQLQVTATDTDGPAALSYEWTIVSGGGTLSSATVANPVYTPADVVGTQTIKLKVEVGDGAATVNGSLTLRVDDANPPPLGTELLKSDFASSAALAGWSFVDEGTISAPSKWGIVSGALAQQSNIRDGSTANQLPKLGTYLLWSGGANWTNYRAKFKLRSSDDDTLGVMFRVADANNYYRLNWDRQLNQRQLMKRVGGVFTLLAADNVPYVMGQTYDVEIIAEGSQLEVWIDGARIFQVSDASLTKGSIAFYTWQNNAAFFDDLQVNAIE
jgi:hypothetical protein